MVQSDSMQMAGIEVRKLLSGALDMSVDNNGWVRPRRFLPSQMHALTSCMAWHPGLFRQMAATTAGIRMRFATDATEVTLEVLVDTEPSATTAILNQIPERAAMDREKSQKNAALVYDLRDYSVDHGPYDGFTAVVDGRVLDTVFPQFGRLHVSLIDPRTVPGEGIVALPGLGARHEVEIWLPCLRGCSVRGLWTDGTYVEPLPSEPKLLVLGDSVGQGFCCGDPARAFPSIVARELGLDLVNQSLARQVFQPTAVLGANVDDVEHVVVELGLGYKYGRCSSTAATQDVRGLLLEITHRWPMAHLWVLTPLWSNPKAAPSCEGSCYEALPRIISEVCKRYGATMVDGLRLMEHNADLMKDGRDHPGSKGHAQIARRLATIMRNGNGVPVEVES